MKNLTKVAVMVAAIDLMKDNEITTTLEVKEALRAEGYFAKQSEVSKLMFEIAGEEGWEIDENGTYRTYSLPDGYNTDDRDEDDDVEDNADPDGVKIMHKDKYGNPYPVYVREKSITRATKGDWKVADSGGYIEKYYDGIYTRDEVRSAFSREAEVPYVDTRATKIKE